MSEPLLFGGCLIAIAAVCVGLFLSARRRPVVLKPLATVTPPEHWVGITVYEGNDPAAAKAAFREMQSQYHTLPGDREWIMGDKPVQGFKVV